MLTLLSNAARGPDICHFSVAGRAGGARCLWPHPPTPQHRRLHAFVDRLRGSAVRDALAGNLSRKHVQERPRGVRFVRSDHIAHWAEMKEAANQRGLPAQLFRWLVHRKLCGDAVLQGCVNPLPFKPKKTHSQLPQVVPRVANR